MPKPKSLYSDEINEARDELRSSLAEVAPAKPFGPDFRRVLKAMESDPRIEQKVAEWRRFQHLADGADMQTALKLSQEDMVRFKQVFGGGGR